MGRLPTLGGALRTIKGGARRPMTTNTVVTKLLRFKGLCVRNCWFEGRDSFVVAVKPHRRRNRVFVTQLDGVTVREFLASTGRSGPRIRMAPLIPETNAPARL